MTGGEINYEEILVLAKQLGCTVKDLLALSTDNDPFYVGRETHVDMAKWFAALWSEKGFAGRGGVHLRRVHYQVLGNAKHDGTPYENNRGDWNYLMNAAKYARILTDENGDPLVDPEDIIDRRNPEPHIYLQPPISEEAGVEVGELPRMSLPSVSADFARWLNSIYLPDPTPELEITGYDYDDFYQPYHVEVWAEKSTMNDVLVPACSVNSTNLVTGLGYMTITSVVALLRRIEGTEKPARILYISDYDAAGKNMPNQVGTHIEFWMKRYLPDADIRLERIVLTEAQIEKYGLGELAIEDEDTGEEKVELDALESLHPGELGTIVEEHIARFQDPDLEGNYRQAREEAQEAAERALEEVLSEHLEELEEIRQEARPILEKYEEVLQPIAAEMEAELAPLRVKLRELRQAIEESVSSFEPDLPELPEADVAELDTDDEDWHFDSRREYMEQLLRFKTPEQRERMEATMRERQRVCPVCGTSFVAGKRGGVYCSSPCRVKDYRRKRRESKRS